MRTLGLAVICAATVFPAQAKVAPTSLRALALGAGAVVVGRVERVVDVPGERYALLEVEETLSGPAATRLALGFHHDSRCDLVGFALGERTLFFLEPYLGGRSVDRLIDFGVEGVFVVSHHGRGGMPIRAVAEVLYVTPFGDVELPPDLLTIPGPDPQTAAWWRSVSLEGVRQLVRETRGGKGP